MTDAKDLASAIKHEQSTIEVEGDLAKHVIRIKVTGPVAWGVCIAAITVAVASIVAAPETAGTSSFIGLPAMAGATATLGMGTTIAAVTIAVAGGGVGILNKLRDYDMEKISDDKVILIRKHQKK